MKSRNFFVWLFVVGLTPSVLAMGPPDRDGDDGAERPSRPLVARTQLVRPAALA